MRDADAGEIAVDEFAFCKIIGVQIPQATTVESADDMVASVDTVHPAVSEQHIESSQAAVLVFQLAVQLAAAMIITIRSVEIEDHITRVRPEHQATRLTRVSHQHLARM